VKVFVRQKLCWDVAVSKRQTKPHPPPARDETLIVVCQVVYQRRPTLL
jgi:hypothetical protein